ncbi:MAG TPA: GGDEF domain-containing protein [Polyangiaceae bacterium]|nr:GGDEF domain-containing protein [Polyangiaceae bacterium]
MGGDAPEDDLEATRVSHVTEFDETAARSQRDRACLIVLAGSNVGEMYRLEGGETVVGRGNNATIRLNDDGISRRHARFFHLGREVIIEDLQSSNGTTVNGDPVTTRRSLADGDKIRLGSTTVLKFTYNYLDEEFQQRMYDAALRDALTKAYNRKYFLDRLETELAFARRHTSPLSLLMIDLDFFKRVNDTYGHLAGDYVLANFAKVALSALRAEDVFARYGGEEFGLICRGVQLGNGGLLGERIRAIVEASPFDYEGHRVPVTISVGVAAYPEIQAETGLQLIAAADEALYQAKRTGRNRVLLKYSG